VDGGALAVASVQLAHRVLHRALADAVRWKVSQPGVWHASAKRRAQGDAGVDRRGGGHVSRLRCRRPPRGAVDPRPAHRAPASELAGLRWKDVDLDAETLTVAQQRTNANHDVVVSVPKSKSQRQLVLAPATVAALSVHRRRQRAERLALGPAWTDTDYVFVDEAGQPYHPQRYLPMFHAACERAGIAKIRLHDVRHTMATLALQAGVHPKVVQETARPLGDQLTMDVYSHVPQAVRRESASKIAGLVGSG
jgi:integrase